MSWNLTYGGRSSEYSPDKVTGSTGDPAQENTINAVKNAVGGLLGGLNDDYLVSVSAYGHQSSEDASGSNINIAVSVLAQAPDAQPTVEDAQPPEAGTVEPAVPDPETPSSEDDAAASDEADGADAHGAPPENATADAAQPPDDAASESQEG